MLFSGRPQRWRALRTLGLRLALASAFGLGLIGATAAGAAGTPAVPGDTRSSLPIIALSELPPQAQAIERLIRSGGPFSERQDGMVFGNRERRLPLRPRGHYREYTVPTPGAVDRGARRIICGGAQRRAPEACFFTADHYATFSRIAR